MNKFDGSASYAGLSEHEGGGRRRPSRRWRNRLWLPLLVVTTLAGGTFSITANSAGADVPSQQELDDSAERERNGGYDPNPGGYDTDDLGGGNDDNDASGGDDDNGQDNEDMFGTIEIYPIEVEWSVPPPGWFDIPHADNDEKYKSSCLGGYGDDSGCQTPFDEVSDPGLADHLKLQVHSLTSHSFFPIDVRGVEGEVSILFAHNGPNLYSVGYKIEGNTATVRVRNWKNGELRHDRIAYVAELARPQATTPSNATCVDSDGDGWGWDGTQSCRATSGQNPPQSVRQTPVSSNATCVDSDGDGWGWDGTKSCRM